MTEAGQQQGPDTQAVRVLVHGRVTGVGFRYSALREAARFGDLRGYVCNKDSRTVECVVQGAVADVAAFVAWLRHGPPSARVIRCDVTELPGQPEQLPFRIVSY